MGSESISVTRYSCDRCGFSGEYRDTRQYASWGNLTTQHKDGSALLPHGYGADLCPDCMRLFGVWWRQTRSPVTQGVVSLPDDDLARTVGI